MSSGDGGGAPDKSKDIQEHVIEILKQRNLAQPLSGFWYFVSSGFFFMIVGAAILWAAFLTMGSTHASFTFVLVVLGVAVLLYGTGTQGVGNFETVAGEIKYRIGLAGGAGILAFLVGLGIVEKSPDIKRAFQIEKKYLRLTLAADDDGVSSFRGYVPEVMIDGVSAPVYRSGDDFVVFISYFENRDLTKLKVIANFHYVGSEESRNKSLVPDLPLAKVIDINHKLTTIDDGSYDFPRYPEPIKVSLARNDRSEQDQRLLDDINGDGRDQSERPPEPPLLLAQ